jgi:hypothetical protein
MLARDQEAELLRLREELARVEAEIRKADLRVPEVLANYVRRIQRLRSAVLIHLSDARENAQKKHA